MQGVSEGDAGDRGVAPAGPRRNVAAYPGQKGGMSKQTANEGTTATEPAGVRLAHPPRPARDHRIDALRGLALLMMFVDHIPQNLLNRLTLRNVGFADAAEIFVLLAGFASMLAYGRALANEGWVPGLIRIGRRIVKLYLFQLGLVLASIFLLKHWASLHPISPDYLEPELAHGHRNLWRAALLYALPANLNILPLYIALLASFPLIWGLMRRGLAWALVPSAALWVAVNLDPDINMPNWLDPDGWYFNPFAWQFLFALGAAGAVVSRRHGGDLPRHPLLVAAAAAYLVFSAVEAFPYASYGLPSLAPMPLPPPGKTSLAPLRLLDVLAIFYLVASSQAARGFTDTRPGRALALLGRHSLEVFTLGTFIDLLAKLGFDWLGQGLPMQVAVNASGICLLFALAAVLDRRKQRRKAEARATAAAEMVRA